MAKIEEIIENDNSSTVAPPKINNANLGELKATTDDAIAPYMQSLGYIQNHTLSDVHLGLGYAAVICCAAAAYYEYKVGFKEAKSWSIMGVGAYFALNAALYFWGYFIEGSTVYVGSKNGVTVEISSSVKKYDPTYNIVIKAYKSKDVSGLTHLTANERFEKWFDAEGTFVKKPFDNWLGTHIISEEKALASGKKKKKK